MKERDFIKQKNILDIKHQESLTVLEIVTVGIVTLIITVWFANFDLLSKIQFTIVIFACLLIFWYWIYNRLKDIKQKIMVLD